MSHKEDRKSQERTTLAFLKKDDQTTKKFELGKVRK